VEWVETTGKTVEEAKDMALDQLGVDEQDAEFEVTEEPRTGLFGRVRGEARVRARVAPRPQRPRQERAGRAKAGGASPKAGPGSGRSGPSRGPSTAGRGAGRRAPTGDASASPAAGADEQEPTPGGSTVDEIVSVDQQADIMEGFLDGLLGAFGATASVSRRAIDEDTVELAVEGEDLGLLIGPKGQTLQAVQELARTVVQRRAAGSHEGRVRIDVSGYRQHRREALERFTRQVAEDVQRSGARKALEPMNAADRKVVHDTANTIDGVGTASEGEEPRRRVVILPAAD